MDRYAFTSYFSMNTCMSAHLCSYPDKVDTEYILDMWADRQRQREGLTKPYVDGVGWSRSGVEKEVGISSVEVAIKLLGHRHRVHIFHPPYLQAWLFSCTLELLVNHHDLCNYEHTHDCST